MDNVRRKHLSFRKTRIKMLVSDQVAETCDACDRTEDLRALRFSSVPSMALILLVKSGHGYLPPSVVNHKSVPVMVWMKEVV